ncbi:hypothetical protein A2U01_0047100, partial [Trifolium medium]|nr:hypothetical protein [Trifolium medium]
HAGTTWEGLIFSVIDGGWWTMAERKNSTIECHGAAILHKLAMADVKKSSTAIHHDTAMADI